MTNLLTKYDKIKLFSEFENFIARKDGIPVEIFCAELSVFESIVKYMVENRQSSYSEIGRLVQKDRQVIWTTYKRAAKKVPARFFVGDCLHIPMQALSGTGSLPELVVAHLRSSGLTLSKIATILKRDDRTVWTWYNRYKKKNG